MNNTQHIGNRVREWLNDLKIYACFNGNGYFISELSNDGTKEYRLMGDEFLGFFLPIYCSDIPELTSCVDKFSSNNELTIRPSKDEYSLRLLHTTHCYPFEYSDSSILSTIGFATFHHKFQKRKSDGAPYITHLLEVAQIVQAIGDVADAEIVHAALLHDIIEDTHLNLNSLIPHFSAITISLVKELTYLGDREGTEKRAALYEQLAQGSAGAKIIKLADICSNVASIPSSWDEQRKIEYVDWCDSVAELCKSSAPKIYSHYVENKRDLKLP
jgi:guanosine-3',5'-bis(diphosphate) 3'-pyrophosphohydrolase